MILTIKQMKKIINIRGMHCMSCEILLEKELKNLKGVKLLSVSHKK
jgi:copper chaperone CopZ